MESGQLNHMSRQRVLSNLGARSLLGDFLGSRLLRLRQLVAQAFQLTSELAGFLRKLELLGLHLLLMSLLQLQVGGRQV